MLARVRRLVVGAEDSSEEDHLTQPSFARRALMLVASAVLVGAVALSAQAGATGSGDPVIRIASGRLRGLALATGGRVFDGIPYAAPPVGALRWRPPAPVTPWLGVRGALRTASPCAQLPLTILPGGKSILPGASNKTGSTSEDCLYLNVWTAAGRSRRPRPVYVWFHGGSNIYGAGSDYDGSALAARGVDVVTVNYRLGPLGFLAHPALAAQSSDHASGDYGLMDQLAALRWVRRNIRAFGGNPGQVTIGGQSAGSFDTCYLIASPIARGLLQRAIQESGSCLAGGAAKTPTLGAAQATGEQFAASVGCPNPVTAAVCLRAVPVKTLIGGELTGSWGPNTGTSILPRSPPAAWAAGTTSRVPVLSGSAHDEYRFFTFVYIDFLAGHPLTPATYAAQVRKEQPQNAAAILHEYPTSAYRSPNLAYAAYHTDSFFACPAHADDGFYGARVPTYAYEFHDENAPPFVDAPNTPQGAFHASELAYLFPNTAVRPLNAAQRRLSRVMLGYWSRFISTGNPNRSGLPAWPRFHPSRDKVLELVPGEIAPTSRFAADHHCVFWHSVLGIPAS